MNDDPTNGARRDRPWANDCDAAEHVEVEVEVTSLRGSRAERVSESRAFSNAHGTDADMLHLTHQRGTGRRVRRLSASALAIGAVALAVVLVLAGNPQVRGTVRASLTPPTPPTPTPTETLALGADTLAFEYTVPWGTLLVDGKTVTIPPGAQVILPRGRHNVVYRAAPFAPVSCVLSVPASPRLDTCPLNAAANINPASQARTLNIGDIPDRLPAPQLASLQQLAASTLAPATTGISIQPGDHYADAAGRVQTATTRFTADQVLALAGSNGFGMKLPGEGTCYTICLNVTTIGPTGTATVPSAGWNLSVQFGVAWRYTAPDGTVLANNVAPAPAGYPMLAYFMPFSVTWDASHQAWHLADPREAAYTPGTAPSCAFVEPSFFANEMAFTNTGGGGPARNILPSPHSFDEGCALAVRTTPGSANTPFMKGDALFLYRCGALLAVNNAARRMAPKLPLASAHEVALANDWAQQADAAGGYGIPPRI